MESHACTGKIHAGGSACTSPPVRFDHLFFTGRFCLQCFVPLPCAVFFHMYKPQTNLVNVCAQLISLRNEHFFGDTFDVLCFHMQKYRHALTMSIIFHVMKIFCRSTRTLIFSAHRNDGAMRHVLVGYLSPLPHSGSDKSAVFSAGLIQQAPPELSASNCPRV